MNIRWNVSPFDSSARFVYGPWGQYMVKRPYKGARFFTSFLNDNALSLENKNREIVMNEIDNLIRQKYSEYENSESIRP